MTRSLMKHTMSELSDLPVEALVDAERKKVTLRVPRVDSALIIDFVCRVLPDQGIVAFRDDNIKNAAWLTLKAPYTLFIEVFDVVHKAHVVRLASISGPPQATLVLEDPAQERKRRCLETATDVLRALHDRGVEARVVGSVGR
ncbi:hypothetical protein, partial [Ideonella benzenivorans]|uniref:hypothetical protein n=1 Tax=Ideonella benzenivorans TaxID=2831643 RepID=UPI001CED5440